MTTDTLLSPERLGRITGSRVGAILGLSRYATKRDVLREMVRQCYGAESEFAGNEYTAHGQAEEPVALARYAAKLGVTLHGQQVFVPHPQLTYLGVSPDALVDEDIYVEVKAPVTAKYTSIAKKPEYEAQVQLGLACTGRPLAHFVIHREGRPLIVEDVERDEGWLEMHHDRLENFIVLYRQIIADPDMAWPYLEPKAAA